MLPDSGACSLEKWQARARQRRRPRAVRAVIRCFPCDSFVLNIGTYISFWSSCRIEMGSASEIRQTCIQRGFPAFVIDLCFPDVASSLPAPFTLMYAVSSYENSPATLRRIRSQQAGAADVIDMPVNEMLRGQLVNPYT